VLTALFLLVLSFGVLAAGIGYVRLARRMRGFQTTRGRVVAREVVQVGVDTIEPRWGRGGGYAPSVAFTYDVGGRQYRGDRSTFVRRGLRRRLAEEALAAIPGDVDVFYNPEKPQEAYLETHTQTLGLAIVAFGCVLLFAALVSLLG
jgi:hypothetical protein